MKHTTQIFLALVLALSLGVLGCDSGDTGGDGGSDPADSEMEDGTSSENPSDTGSENGENSTDSSSEGGDDTSTTDAVVADVVEVSTSGEAGDYTFEVTVRSPDTGCEQYADWWEVVSTDGELLHRRILAHSHTDEQPFTRSGGPVEIGESETVIVRAHMSSDSAEVGYGGRAMRGSPAEGFEEADLDEEFASDLEDADPQPSDCAF